MERKNEKDNPHPPPQLIFVLKGKTQRMRESHVDRYHRDASHVENRGMRATWGSADVSQRGGLGCVIWAVGSDGEDQPGWLLLLLFG